jgi:hypothetical protein
MNNRLGSSWKPGWIGPVRGARNLLSVELAANVGTATFYLLPRLHFELLSETTFACLWLTMVASPTLSPSFSQLDLSRQASSPAPIARNPVALRIYKVLGATFNDEASKEALLTLTELYSSPTTPGKGKEVQQDAVGGPGEGPTSNGALSFLDGAPPGETAARARKNLRRDVEAKLAESSQKFLRAFGEVDQVCVCSVRVGPPRRTQNIAETRHATITYIRNALTL